MSSRRRIAFLAVVVAQALVPIGMAGASETHLALGEEVRLKAMPVDPHDPFRGEYVALTYEISRVRLPLGVRPGETVYVELHEGPRRWVATRVHATPPRAGATFIRGRVVSGGRIEYGIESYFVEEGQGPRLEQAIARDDLYVDVVLDDDGEAKIEEVVVAGE